MKQHEANLHAAKESHSRRQAHSYAEKLRAKREKAKQARSSTSSLDPFAKDRERDIETFITMEATMQELERCFKILDTDSSGDLDQKEVEVFFDELHKQPLNVHTGSVDALRKTMADAVLKAGKLKYAKFVAVYCKALYTKR